jgi:hypothetical protein
MWKDCGFLAFECGLFLLPAFPDSLTTRLAILGIYTVGHIMGAQRVYLRLKRKALKGGYAVPLP